MMYIALLLGKYENMLIDVCREQSGCRFDVIQVEERKMGITYPSKGLT